MFGIGTKIIQIAVASPVTLFEPAFARRALLAAVCVAVIGGMLGTSIVLRELPFFVHAVGAGAYPALVLAAGLGISAAIAAPLGALTFAGALWLLTRGRGTDPNVGDSRTGLLVAASLAAGAILAGEFASGGSRIILTPEAMLFGSVLTVGDAELAGAGLMAIVSVVIVYFLAGRWLAAGFDRGAAPSLGVLNLDGLLLLIVAAAVAAALPLTGALMVGALLVIPAATARMICDRAGTMTTVALALATTEALTGLYLALAFDLPAGAAIAAVAGGAFVAVALFAYLRSIAPRMGRPGRVSVNPTLVALVTVLIVLPLVSGCGSSSPGGSGGKSDAAGELLSVVATTTQVADIVRQIGGANIAVSTMLKPGADPHNFEPKPSDVAALADARVIFRSGGEIDAWLQPAIDAAGGGRGPIDLSNAAVLLPAVGAGGGRGGAFNAHWYMDPVNLESVGKRVRDELIKADPSARETYRANAAHYAAKARAANASLGRCVERLPIDRRAIVADHDEFDYLAERFGLRIAARLRAAGGGDPSVSDMQLALKNARAANARSVVTSVGEGGKLARAVAERLNVPLLELYADSLPQRREPSTALDAIRFNLDQIAEAASKGSVRCRTLGN